MDRQEGTDNFYQGKKVLWNKQLQHITNKVTKALIIIRWALGKSWGFKQNMVHWLYTVVMRSLVTYDYIIWWSTVEKKGLRTERLALRTTSTPAIEILLYLLDLHILLLGETRSLQIKAEQHWEDLTTTNIWKSYSRYVQRLRHSTILLW